jgi:adenine deaminase
LKLKGNIIDISNRRIFKGEITIENGKIKSIEEKDCEENSLF